MADEVRAPPEARHGGAEVGEGRVEGGRLRPAARAPAPQRVERDDAMRPGEEPEDGLPEAQGRDDEALQHAGAGEAGRDEDDEGTGGALLPDAGLHARDGGDALAHERPPTKAATASLKRRGCSR